MESSLSADDPRPSADGALARLVDGNRRFCRGEARRDPFRRETLAELAKAQRPYATILGCSDSRVPPEWIFDVGLGELFVVLGHEGCGAIGASLATKLEGAQFRSRVQLLLDSIMPGLPDFDLQLSR